jgi:hypothetical protein
MRKTNTTVAATIFAVSLTSAVSASEVTLGAAPVCNDPNGWTFTHVLKKDDVRELLQREPEECRPQHVYVHGTCMRPHKWWIFCYQQDKLPEHLKK